MGLDGIISRAVYSVPPSEGPPVGVRSIKGRVLLIRIAVRDVTDATLYPCKDSDTDPVSCRATISGGFVEC